MALQGMNRETSDSIESEYISGHAQKEVEETRHELKRIKREQQKLDRTIRVHQNLLDRMNAEPDKLYVSMSGLNLVAWGSKADEWLRGEALFLAQQKRQGTDDPWVPLAEKYVASEMVRRIRVTQEAAAAEHERKRQERIKSHRKPDVVMEGRRCAACGKKSARINDYCKKCARENGIVVHGKI